MVKVLVDYRAVADDELTVHRGDLVTVLNSDPGRYHVSKNETDANASNKGWVPAYVLNLLTRSSTNPTKSRPGIGSGLKKLRKPSFSSSSSSTSASKTAVRKEPLRQKNSEYANVDSAEVLETTVEMHETAFVQCVRASNVTSVRWRNPQGSLVFPGSKYATREDDGAGHASLEVTDCGLEDAGEYQCVQMLGDGGNSIATTLTIHVNGELN